MQLSIIKTQKMLCFPTLDATARLHLVVTPAILIILSIVLPIMQTHIRSGSDCLLYDHNVTLDSHASPRSRDCAVATFYQTREGETKVAQYKYFCFVLLGQATIFVATGFLWIWAVEACGMPLRSLYEMARHARAQTDPSAYKHAVENLAGHIYASASGRSCGRASLTLAKGAQNFIFALHGVLELLFLCYFSDNCGLKACGVNWLRDYYGMSQPEFANFPRVVYCERDEGVFECVENFNIFQEKIVIFLWFWFLLITLVAILSTLCALATIGTSFCPRNRDALFVSRFLRARRLADGVKAAQRFTKELLGPDGVMALRGVSQQGGDLVTTDVMEALWNGAQPECITPVLARRSMVNGDEVQLTSMRYDDVDPYGGGEDLNLSMQKPLLHGTATRNSTRAEGQFNA